MFKTTGHISYNPKRNFSDNSKNKWWLTLEMKSFEEVSRYYRWFIDKQWYDIDRIKTFKTEYFRPSHPFHVSIIRGETPKKNVDKWGKFNKNKKYEIEYGFPYQVINPPKAKGLFWMCDVKFVEYTMYREFYGLDTQKNGKDFVGHVTIARSFV